MSLLDGGVTSYCEVEVNICFVCDWREISDRGLVKGSCYFVEGKPKFQGGEGRLEGNEWLEHELRVGKL